MKPIVGQNHLMLGCKKDSFQRLHIHDFKKIPSPIKYMYGTVSRIGCKH